MDFSGLLPYDVRMRCTAVAVLLLLLLNGVFAGERLEGAGFSVEGRDRNVSEILKAKVEASAPWKAFLSGKRVRFHVRSLRSVSRSPGLGGGSYWPGYAVVTMTAVEEGSGQVLLRRTERGSTPAVVMIKEAIPQGNLAERVAGFEREERRGSSQAQEAALQAAEASAIVEILKSDPAKGEAPPKPPAPDPAPSPSPPERRKEKPKPAPPAPKPDPKPDPERAKKTATFLKDLSSKDAAERGVAVRGLAGLGPDAKDALPALLKLIQAPLAGVQRDKTDTKDLRPDVRKRLEESEEKYRKETEEHLRGQAVEAVAKIGPSTKPAIEMLAKVLLETTDGAIRRAAIEGLAKADPAHGAALAPAVPALLKEIRGATSLKDEALAALTAAGPAAKAAASELVTLLGSSREDREAALRALAAIGPAAEPELVKALKHEKDAVRQATAEALGEGGVKTGVPALAEALKTDRSERVRMAAIGALFKLKPDPKECLSAVLDALKDPGFPVIRHTAVKLLAAWGPDAAEAALPLAEFARGLKVQDQEERERCCKAIAGMGTAAAPACATILKILEDQPGRARRVIEETLFAIGEGAVPALTEGLRSPQPHVRASSADILGRIGPASRGAVPALIEAMKDADLNGARLPAIAALGRIGPAAEASMPALVALLDDDRDNQFRNAAAGSLLKMGEKALPALEGLLARKDDWLGFGLGFELGKLGPEDKAVVPFLVKGARLKGWKARLHAASALGQIGEGLPAVAEAYADLFPGEGDGMKGHIALKLAELGPAGAAAAPVLVASLGDANGMVRDPCAKALPQVDPEGAVAIPLLRSALAKGPPLHRELAAQVIGAYGAKAAGAAEALRVALRDEDYYVALAAEEALKRVTGS